MLEGRDIISINDFNKKEIEAVLDKSEEMEDILREKKCMETMKGKILANLFFEPSTRTRLSFSSAMHRLGGNVISLEKIKTSSMAKGESLTDTIRMVDKYSDLIVIRHPDEYSAKMAAGVAENPVINGGDGANQHPTQALIDLCSIRKFKGKIENLNVTLLGDLKHARVIKSLAYGLAIFKANITLVSPAGLELENKTVDELKSNFGITVSQTNDICSGIKNADVLYVCRMQKERFKDLQEAGEMQNTYRITPELLEQGKDSLIVMHALPKVGEIDHRVDQTKFAKYFEEAAFGVPVRMAVISLVVVG